MLRLNGRVAFEDQTALDILNPFRDRGPERVAESILREVQAGRCDDVTRRLGEVRPDPQCPRDTKLRLVSWRLRARDDKASGDTILLFGVRRDFGTDGVLADDPYWFQVRKEPNGQWKVVSLERWF